MEWVNAIYAHLTVQYLESTRYVTLSHLRSKEFQRIHLPCIPQHRETSKCTPVYIEMYPGKVVALLKEQATFIKASMALMWMRQWNHPLFVLYKLRQKSIVGINQCSRDNYHKLKCFQKQQSNDGILVSLPFYKLENVT